MSARVKKLKEDINALLLDTPSGDEGDAKVEDVDEVIQVSAVRPKPKKELTETQKAALKRGQDVMRQRHAENRKRLQEIEEQTKKELEKNIVKKALAIKRKNLKEAMLLEAISDDSDTELPLERVKQVVKKVKEDKQMAPEKKVKKIIEDLTEARRAAPKRVQQELPPKPEPTQVIPEPPAAKPKPTFVFLNM